MVYTTIPSKYYEELLDNQKYNTNGKSGNPDKTRTESEKRNRVAQEPQTRYQHMLLGN
jgi:hypothetical protein